MLYILCIRVSRGVGIERKETHPIRTNPALLPYHQGRSDLHTHLSIEFYRDTHKVAIFLDDSKNASFLRQCVVNGNLE